MSNSLRTASVYRGSLFSTILGGLVIQGTQLVFIGLLLGRFKSIGGWSFSEISMLYGMRVCAHACFAIPFGQHATLDFILNDGEYDRFLLRPASPFVQLLTYKFNFGSVGDLVLGIVVLVASAGAVAVDWSFFTIAFLILAIVAGSLVEAGIAIFVSGLSFTLRSTYSLKIAVDSTISDFGSYPTTIFGPIGSTLLTFALPVAFIAFLPATVLLGKAGANGVPIWLASSSVLIGPVIFWGGYRFFIRQSRHYSSPGS